MIWNLIIFCVILFALLIFWDQSQELKSLKIQSQELLEEKERQSQELKSFRDMFSNIDDSILSPLMKGLYKTSLVPTNISEKQLSLYIQKLLEARRKRTQLAANRPIISGAMETGNFLDKSWIVRYKEECLAAQLNKKLIAPDIPTAGTSCKIIKNIDGDTVWLSIPSLGIDRIKVRIAGFDTPESHKPGHGIYHGAYEACALSDELINKATDISIRYDEEQSKENWLYDKYGRLLAHIFLDGKPLSLSLVEAGYAFYVDSFPLEKGFRVLLGQAEGAARANDLGMWESLNKLKERENRIAEARLSTKEHIARYSELIVEESRYRDALNYLLGSIVVKSKRSLVIHNPDCRYVRSINKENISEAEITFHNIKDLSKCQICGSDILKEAL